MITTETHQLAEKRFYGEAETNPAITMRWHTVALIQHGTSRRSRCWPEPSPATTGRLYRNLVLGQKLATSASTSNGPAKYEGLFEIRRRGEGRTHARGAADRRSMPRLGQLRRTPMPADELQSVKNRYLAGAYRQLTSQLLGDGAATAIADGRGELADDDRIDRGGADR